MEYPHWNLCHSNILNTAECSRENVMVYSVCTKKVGDIQDDKLQQQVDL